MKICKNCGRGIALEQSTGWWKHRGTDDYSCDNPEGTMAEPKPQPK